LIALGVIIVTSAIFAVLSLRATGIGFLMITLAIGQILWGLAYRWISLTGGDPGDRLHERPAPFGFDVNAANGFYYMSLVVFLAAVATVLASPLSVATTGDAIA